MIHSEIKPVILIVRAALMLPVYGVAGQKICRRFDQCINTAAVKTGAYDDRLYRIARPCCLRRFAARGAIDQQQEYKGPTGIFNRFHRTQFYFKIRILALRWDKVHTIPATDVSSYSWLLSCNLIPAQRAAWHIPNP